MATSLKGVAEKVRRTSRAATKEVALRLRSLTGGRGAKHVIFLAGIQRSGTNMMMGAFERHPDTVVFRESDRRAFDNFELKPREVLHALVRASRARHVVFKALCELQELRALLDDFAPAQSIWMVRDLADVVNSHLALWTEMPRFVGAIVQDRNAALWRGRGMSDATHALIRKLYHPGISNASACALFWYFRNVLFFEQALDRDDRVRVVRYESLVTDPDAQLARLFAFLGLDYVPQVSRRVSASSIRKQRAPEIEPAIREVCEALARRFAPLFG